MQDFSISKELFNHHHMVVQRAPVRQSLKRAVPDGQGGLTFEPTLGSCANFFVNFIWQEGYEDHYPEALIINSVSYLYKIIKGKGRERVCHKCKGLLTHWPTSHTSAPACGLRRASAAPAPPRNSDPSPAALRSARPSAASTPPADAQHTATTRGPARAATWGGSIAIAAPPPRRSVVIARDPKAKCANGSGCKYIHDGTGATPTPMPADPLADRIAAAKAAIAPGTPPSLGKRAKPPTPDSSDDL